jgi:glutamyl-tRNA reductase
VNLFCLGLSHKTAPLALRERLAYSDQARRAALSRLDCGRSTAPSGLRELAILSTCNRLELYAIGHGNCQPDLTDLLAEGTGVPAAEFAPHLYTHVNAQAAAHLCQVAAGLDSLVLGEPQILGQVVEAYEMARGQGAAGPVLAALFRAAIRAGKRARTETAISRGAASISSVAVRLASAVVPNLAAAHVVLLGAGEMAALAAEALRAHGVARLTIVNRSHHGAAELARRWEAAVVTFERLPQALAAADIVIASTAAPHILVGPALVRASQADRPERPLVFIDIAVPRNVDPAVTEVPNVHYHDIDDLQGRLNGSLAERERERPAVEAIIQAEAEAFVRWFASLDLAPLIVDLRRRAEEIRQAELERALQRLPGLNDAERQRVEALSQALVNKLLHDPTMRLKAAIGNGHSAEYAETIRHLFDLAR